MSVQAVRNRFEELCSHLKQNYIKLGFLEEQFQSEIDELTVESVSLKETTQGWYFANFHYWGMIYIEPLPKAKLTLLALMVRAWLDEFDDLRWKFDLADPLVKCTTVDDDYINVSIRINFVDDINLVEVVDGEIDFNGKAYDVDEYPVNYAEDGTVNGAPILC